MLARVARRTRRSSGCQRLSGAVWLLRQAPVQQNVTNSRRRARLLARARGRNGDPFVEIGISEARDDAGRDELRRGAARRGAPD